MFVVLMQCLGKCGVVNQIDVDQKFARIIFDFSKSSGVPFPTTAAKKVTVSLTLAVYSCFDATLMS